MAYRKRPTSALTEQEAASTPALTLETVSHCLLSLTQAFGVVPIQTPAFFPWWPHASQTWTESRECYLTRSHEASPFYPPLR